MFGLSVIGSAICTILIPIGTCLNLKCEGPTNYIVFIYALRILTGLFESVSYPAMYTLFEKWVPKPERTIMINISISGACFGTILSFLIAGFWLDIKTEIIGGWTGINYFGGFLGIIWFIFWTWLISESPETHKTINEAEKNYIINTRGG